MRCRMFLEAALLQLALVPGWSLPVAAEGRIPIVFVPGTGGSELTIVSDQPGKARKLFWITPELMEPGRAMDGLIGLDDPGGERATSRVVATKVLKSLPMKVHLSLIIDMETEEGGRLTFQRDLGGTYELDYPVYGRFTIYAREVLAEGRWFEAPYDWRKGACDENSRAIDKVVDNAIKATGSSQVILLAHSLGGLVCRDYIAQDFAKGKVKALVAVGTPWLGAPKAARGLLWGYNFGLGYLYEPLMEMGMKPFYLYRRGPDGKYQKFSYLTRISLLDPEITKQLAGRFPAVYQQLPTYSFMKLYGKASQPSAAATSVFLDHERPEDTIRAFDKAGPALYKAAQAWRDSRLVDNNYGVKHFLVAATCFKGSRDDLHTDMKMARAEDLALFRPEEIGRDMRATKGKGAEVFQKLIAAFSGLGRLTREDAIALANDFYDINPFFHDVGNAFWISSREKLFAKLRETQRFPVYLDNYVAVDHSTEWGDSTAPLLSATAGAVLRLGGEPDYKESVKHLGPGVRIATCELTQGFDHSNMLDDLNVRLQLEKIIDTLNSATVQP